MAININKEKFSDASISQDLGKSGSAQVDLFNGNLTFVHTDVQFNYGNPIISVGHVYSAKGQRDWAYGNNWDISCDEKIEVAPDRSYLKYCNPFGNNEYYCEAKIEVFDSYSHMFGAHKVEKLYLSSQSDNIIVYYHIKNDNSNITVGYQYVMIDPKGNKKLFTFIENLLDQKTFYLEKVELADGNFITYNRDHNRLGTIGDKAGRYINMKHSGIKLIEISDSVGRKKNYTYTGDNLTEIKNIGVDGTEEICLTVEYNSRNLITRITGENGISYLYEYPNNSARVSRVIKQSKYKVISADDDIAQIDNDYINYEIWDITYNIDGVGVEKNEEYDNMDSGAEYVKTKVSTNRGSTYYYGFKTDNGTYYYNALFYEEDKNSIGVAKDAMSICTLQSEDRIVVSTEKNNLLKNGCFNNIGTIGTRPLNWYGFKSSVSTYISLDPVNNTTVLFVPADGKEHSIYQSIYNETRINSNGKEFNSLQGGMYTLCVWIKGGKAAITKEFELSVKHYNCTAVTVMLKNWENDAKITDNEWQCMKKTVYIPAYKLDENGVNRGIESIRVCVNFNSSYNEDDKDLLVKCISLNYGRANISDVEPQLVCKKDNTEIIYNMEDIDYNSSVVVTWLKNQMLNNGGTNIKNTKIGFIDGNEYLLKNVRVINDKIRISKDSNNITKTEYDVYGNPIKQYIWNQSKCTEGSTTNYENNKAFQVLATYDEFNRLTKMTDYRDIKHEIVYSADDVVPKTETNKIYYNDSYKMQTSRTMTDNDYAVASETDELGRVTQYVYQTGEDEPFAKDKLYMVIYSDNSYCRYEYDDFDKVTKLAMGKKTVGSNGEDVFTDEHFYTYEYTLGLLTKVTTDTGDVYTYDYNGMNQILCVKHNNVELVRYEYHITYGDNYENYLDTIKFGKTYRTYFNKYDKPIKTCEIAVQETVLTEITYDEDTEECLQITDTVNNTIIEGNTTWSFDSTTDESTIEASGITNYKHKDYYKEGRLMETEQETENATIYTNYNYVEDLDKGLYPDNRLRAVEYKAKTKVTAKNNITSEETVTNGLNDLGKLTYNYNLLQQQTSDVMQVNENSVYRNVYRTNRTYKKVNGYTTNRITEWNNYTMPTTATAESSFINKYTYDDAGNITSIRRQYIKDNYETVEDMIYRYKYDDCGKLIREDEPYYNTTKIYEYDERGNLTKETKYNYSSGDELLGTPVEKVYTYDENNRMLTMNNFVCAYDEYGRPSKFDYRSNIKWDGSRMTRYSNKYFAYDNRGYLVKARMGNIVQYFTYDANGNLIEEKVNEAGNEEKITYFYSDKNEVLGFTLKKITTTTDSATNVTTTTEEDYPFYYIKDMQGNVCHIVDKNGKLVVSYYYNAWGSLLMTEHGSDYTVNLGNGRNYNGNKIALLNRFFYRSYFLDYDTALYYLKSRFYDPQVGRFLSPDDAKYLDPQTPYGTNLYVYCCNNPVMFIDPEGKSSLLIGILIGFGVGALIGGGFEVAKQAYNGGDWNWDLSSWNWGQIGLSALGGGVAGAISSISYGSGFIGYLTTFLSGGVGSVLGGIISGSVTDFQSGAIAFGIGGVANIAARAVTSLINKGISVSSQKALKSPLYDDLDLSDLVGSGLKNNGYSPIYNKVLNGAAKLILKANGQWLKSVMYSFANAGISSLLSGWY